MADFAALASTTAYLTLLTQISDRDRELAQGLDPASVTPTNVPTNSIRYSSANKRWEKYNGSAWVELIVAASDAFAMTVTGHRGGNFYGTITNNGTLSGGTMNPTTLQRGGSTAWARDDLPDADIMKDRGDVAVASIDTATGSGYYRSVNASTQDGLLVFTNGTVSTLGTLQVRATSAGVIEWRNKTSGTTWTGWKTLYHSGNLTPSNYVLTTTYTAADVLAKLLTVDGSGSGIDADFLDGQSSAYYTDIVARLGYTPLNTAAYTAADVLAKLLTVDGAGSGIDADLLDGLSSAAFAQLTGATFSGGVHLGLNGATADPYGGCSVTRPNNANAYSYFSMTRAGQAAFGFGINTSNEIWIGSATPGGVDSVANSVYLRLTGTNAYIGSSLIWHAGNDGAGSGLDADLLDGQSSAYYQSASNLFQPTRVP